VARGGGPDGKPLDAVVLLRHRRRRRAGRCCSRRAGSQMAAVLALALALALSCLRPQLAALAALATHRLGGGEGEQATWSCLLKGESAIAGSWSPSVASSLAFRLAAAGGPPSQN